VIARIFWVGLTLILSPVLAQASLIHDLSSSIGSGRIEFDAASGNDTSGVVEFLFTADGPIVGGATTFDKDDIDTIAWSVDGDWILTLDLVTNLVPPDFDGASTTVGLSLAYDVGQTPGARPPCVPAGPFTSGDDGVAVYCRQFAGGFSRDVGDLAATPRHVPEPASVALFGLVLAAAGLDRRRKKLAT
jgi:hypothetical protein